MVEVKEKEMNQEVRIPTRPINDERKRVLPTPATQEETKELYKRDNLSNACPFLPGDKVRMLPSGVSHYAFPAPGQEVFVSLVLRKVAYEDEGGPLRRRDFAIAMKNPDDPSILLEFTYDSRFFQKVDDQG